MSDAGSLEARVRALEARVRDLNLEAECLPVKWAGHFEEPEFILWEYTRENPVSVLAAVQPGMKGYQPTATKAREKSTTTECEKTITEDHKQGAPGASGQTDPRASKQEAPKSHSKLERLPVEVRNRIYALVLPHSTQELRFTIGQFTPVPLLLHISQLIRREASLLYYSSTKFEIMLQHRNRKQPTAWLRSLTPDARKALHANPRINIRLFFDCSYPNFDAVASFLGRAGAVVGPAPFTFWRVSAEHCKYERSRVKTLTSFAAMDRAAQPKYTAQEVERVVKKAGGYAPAVEPPVLCATWSQRSKRLYRATQLLRAEYNDVAGRMRGELLRDGLCE